MNNLEAQIKTVTDKLQALLKKNTFLQRENEMLTREINDLRQKEENHKISVFSLTQKVNILKAASGTMTKTEQKEFEKRVDQYIKEIDKCIGLLSE